MELGSITIPELPQLIGVSERSVERNIKNLQEEKLKRVGPDKGGHWEVINYESSQKE
jgi:ATP-dependent DNA helicase RecG